MRSFMKAAVSLVALLVSTYSIAEESGQASCTLSLYTSVDFSFVGDGLISVPVTVNDVSTELILDLASTFSAVSSAAVKSLKLQTRSWPANLARVRYGSKEVASVGAAESTKIGRLNFGKVDFLISNTLAEVRLGGSLPVVGTLSMGFFSNVDLELDFASRKLNLYSQDHCPGKVVYWADSYAAVPMRKGTLGDVYFLMELEGKKIQTTLYTATTITTLYTDASKALFGFDDKSDGVTTEIDASGHRDSTYRAMALTTDGLSIMNAKILLANRPQGCGFIRNKLGKDNAAGYEGCYGAYPLRLGVDVLQKLHIYLATKENVLYFTAVDAARKSEPDAKNQ